MFEDDPFEGEISHVHWTEITQHEWKRSKFKRRHKEWHALYILAGTSAILTRCMWVMLSNDALLRWNLPVLQVAVGLMPYTLQCGDSAWSYKYSASFKIALVVTCTQTHNHFDIIPLRQIGCEKSPFTSNGKKTLVKNITWRRKQYRARHFFNMKRRWYSLYKAHHRVACSY